MITDYREERFETAREYCCWPTPRPIVFEYYFRINLPATRFRRFPNDFALPNLNPEPSGQNVGDQDRHQNQSKIAHCLGVFPGRSRKKLTRIEKHRDDMPKISLNNVTSSGFFHNIDKKIAQNSRTPRRDDTNQSKCGEHVVPKTKFFDVFWTLMEKRRDRVSKISLKRPTVSGLSQNHCKKSWSKSKNTEMTCPKSV